MLFRAFRKKSSGEFVEQIDSIAAREFTDSSDAKALASVAAFHSIDISDLEVVKGNSDPRTGTLIHQTLPWGERERNARNAMLAATDWTQAADSPLSSDKKTEWATYRQALRDLPANYTDSQKVTWPTKPS
tara:strand:+ start:1022 stop:1414 length:393 start_codon:yes stop_codon:yes gene_type:complete